MAQDFDNPTTDDLRDNIRHLLDIVAAEKRPCSRCGRPIWFVVNPKSGKRMPITETALNHFADCPNAAQFKYTKA